MAGILFIFVLCVFCIGSIVLNYLRHQELEAARRQVGASVHVESGVTGTVVPGVVS